MPSVKGNPPESWYSEPLGARNFLVLLTAKTENSVILKQRKIPFAVLEMLEESLPFLDESLIAAARRLLGGTVISITEKRILPAKPKVSRYGKEGAGRALTSLIEELFVALPDSESILAFSNPDGEWRLVGYRLGSVARGSGTVKADLSRLLDFG